MQIEKKTFGIVRLFSYIINFLIIWMMLLYLFDFGVKYFNLVTSFSPIIINYYMFFLPLDISSLFFDVFILYFLFSARKVVVDRVLSGAGKFVSAILSAFFVYLLKFLFVNFFVYFRFISIIDDVQIYYLFNSFLLRLLLFFVFYLIFAFIIEHSKSVRWYFGNNYRGLYDFKGGFYLSFKKYLLSFLKIVFMVLLLFFPVLILGKSMILKLVVSLLLGFLSTYFLFFKKKIG